MSDLLIIDPKENDGSIAALDASASEIRTFNTNVKGFQAGKALETMYPGMGLVAEAQDIAASFDPHASELAISGFAAKLVPSSSAKSIVESVRGYETGSALKALDSFAGIVSAVDPSVLNRPEIKFIFTWYNPIKAFYRSLAKVNKRLDAGKRTIEKQRRLVVSNISALEGMEGDSLDQLQELLKYAHAAEIVTAREEKALAVLEGKNDPNDLNLPAKRDNQRVIVSRLNRRTLDLKAAAMNSILVAKVADAGQKALVIIHDDMQFAVDVLHDQLTTKVAAAITLHQGKKAGKSTANLRKASADLSVSTGELLGEVTQVGEDYLTSATEDLRGLIALRDSVVKWSENTKRVVQLTRDARESGEAQLQEISKSLQVASNAFAGK